MTPEVTNPLAAPDSILAPPAGRSDSARTSGLECAYAEYVRREEEEGKAPDADAFCADYPDLRASLGRLLSVHRMVREKPELLAGPTRRWPEPGERFLGFVLKRELGRGAFARVFLGHEPALGGRPVVVKVSRLGAAEARTLGRLMHPNVVPIHSVQRDVESGLSAVCMPFLGEATLCDLLDRVLAGPLPPQDGTLIRAVACRHAADAAAPRQPESYVAGIRRLAEQVLEALAFIHREGVVHRDLKPSNILLTPDGTAMLLDFNLSGDARRADAVLGGTPGYMAPEQLALMDRPGAAPARDARADLFSLGVVLHELLTGAHPFGPLPVNAGPAVLTPLLLERQSAGALPVRAQNPSVDAALAALVDSCLAYRPESRPATAEAALQLLREPVGGKPLRPVWRKARAGIAVAVGACLVGFAMLLFAPNPAAAPVPVAVIAGRADAEMTPAQAVEHFSAALRTDGQNAAAWLGRGLAYLKMAETDNDCFALAAHDLQTADKLCPAGRTKACVGYALHRMRQYKEAEHWYEEAVRADYRTAALLNNLGCVRLHVGSPQQMDQAVQELTDAIKLAPKLQSAYHNRARALEKKALATRPPDVACCKRALADCKQALAVGPASSDLCLLAAVSCVRCAAPDDAALRNDAIEYLKRGLACGLAPETLKQSVLQKSLSDHPAFRELRDRPGAAPPLVRAQLIVALPTD